MQKMIDTVMANHLDVQAKVAVKEAAEVLHEADDLIAGDRQHEYGPPQVNFARIADVWNWWMEATGRDSVLDPSDVAMMMALLKMARVANNPDSRDSYVDLAAYSALGYMLSVEEGNTWE